MDINFEVNRLNRLFRIYSVSTKDKGVKPYRIARIKYYLENLFTKITEQYEIVAIDTQNIKDYFSGISDLINPITEKKIKALRAKDYEEAAKLRDKEKIIIRDYLMEIGVPSNVFFFQRDNKIFKA